MEVQGDKEKKECKWMCVKKLFIKNFSSNNSSKW